MDIALFARHTDYEWEIAPHGAMRVPAVIYADEALIRAMDHKVYEQVCNVATLPGTVKASYAMPDAHWGYGFPIGGVAAFAPPSNAAAAALPTSSTSRNTARCAARVRIACRNTPRNASAMRWARWAAAIIILRYKRSPKSLTPRRQKPLAFAKTMSSSASIAVRAGWGIRSAPNF